MATMCTLKVEKKHKRGWAYESVVVYPNWPNNPTRTFGGHDTLASTLWHVIGDFERLPGAQLGEVIVRGKSMSHKQVWEIVRAALRDGVLAWKLPAYSKFIFQRREEP